MTLHHRPSDTAAGSSPALLKQIQREETKGLDVHLVLDNYAPHKTVDSEPVARRAATLASALHPHAFQLAQAGRTLLRSNHQ